MSSRPPPLGSIEPDMDIPSEISDAGSKAGAQAVIKHLIGVDFPPDLNKKAERDAFSRSVAGNIFRTFAEVRGSMSKFATDADLAKILDQKIGEELRKSQGRVKTMDQAEQSAITLNVILDIIGVDVLEQRASELLLPYESMLPNSERGTLTKEIDFTVAPPTFTSLLGSPPFVRRVTINPAHSFWRKDKAANGDELRDQIRGKPLAQVGISIEGVPATEVLDGLTAELITGTPGAPVQWESVDLKRTYPVLNGLTSGKSWSVNLNALMREKGTIALGLDGTTLGGANQAELAFAFEQDRALWKRMVPALANENPTDFGIPPVITPPTPGKKWSDIVAEAVFAKLGKTPTDRAATTTVELHKVKEEVMVKAEVFDRLRDGAYNRTGAVIAMAMLAERPTLLTSVESGAMPDLRKKKTDADAEKTAAEAEKTAAEAEKTTAEGEKAAAQADRAAGIADKKDIGIKRAVQGNVETFKKLTVPPFEFKDAPSFDILKTEVTRLKKDRDNVGSSLYTAWDSDYARAHYGSKAPNTITTDKEKNAAEKNLNTQVVAADKDLISYQKIANALTLVKLAHNKSGLPACPELDAYFIAGTNNFNDATLTNARSALDIAAEIEGALKFGDLDQADKDADAKIAAADAAIKDADAKIVEADKKVKACVTKVDDKDKIVKQRQADLDEEAKKFKGDTLQHAVFKKYCEEKGITNPDETANYIAARSFLDDEVQRSINGMLDERFDEEDGWEYSLHNSFYYKVINQVAKASGVSIQETKPKSEQGYFRGSDYYKEPDWAGASYESLVSSYHSLRRMHDGQEGTEFNLSGSNEVKRQMKTIARIIATKFGMDYYTATYGNLKAEEVKKLKAKPQRVTTGVIEKLLNGDPPAGYEARIAHVLKTAKGKVNPYRRKAKAVGKWPFMKAYGLAWGNDKWSLKNGVVSAASGIKTGVVEGAKFGWKKKLAIATLGTLAVASGGVLAPALFAATYAASGGDEPPAAK